MSLVKIISLLIVAVCISSTLVALVSSKSFPWGFVSSPSSDALASFGGQLAYQPEESNKIVKMTQELFQVSTEVVSEGVKLLKLEMTSGELRLTINKTEENESFVSNATMKLSWPIRGHEHCTIDGITGFRHNSSVHYYCMRQVEYDCLLENEQEDQSQRTKLASLIIKNLEFEVDGDASIVGTGEFSTERLMEC